MLLLPLNARLPGNMTVEPASARVPSEVWWRIITYLYRAPPLPNGRNEDRSSIRQPHLAVAMRVNKVRLAGLPPLL